MNSINTGKQQTGSFSWYSGLKDNQIKAISVEKSSSDNATIQVIPSMTPVSISIAGSPKNSPLPRAPVESSSLLIPQEVLMNVSPVVDRIQARLSPKEPSRIKKTPIIDRSSNKHQSAPLVEELPLKRAKVDDLADELKVALNLKSDFRDFNTVADSDIVDFWFSHQVPSEIIALEETERKDRISRGANPLVSGKFYQIQKELLSKSKPVFSVAPIQKTASSIAETLSEITSTIVEKGTELIDSAKDALNTSFSETLNEIAQEANYAPVVPLETEADWKEETIEFVWPRIKVETKAAWVVAKSELATSNVDPLLFGKWKAINTEIKQLASKKSLLESFDGAIVGKAAQAIDNAIHYTADWIQSLRMFKGTYDAEWARLQEEKERAGRINNRVDPVMDTRKAKVEEELLRSVKTQY